MFSSRYVSWCFIITSFPLSSIASNPQILLPKPNGAFEVGMGVMELIDESRFQPFAPTVRPPKLMISLFYPVDSHKPTIPVNYMPPETAAYEDAFEESINGLLSPNGTFEKLALQLASGFPQSQSTPDFPIVLFQPGEGTTRLFYSVIAQNVASSGYIVITMDAPYDVDIVEYPDGSEALINATVTANPTLADEELAVSARAQDASFVLDQLRNASIISQLIPGSTRGLDVCKVSDI